MIVSVSMWVFTCLYERIYIYESIPVLKWVHRNQYDYSHTYKSVYVAMRVFQCQYEYNYLCEYSRAHMSISISMWVILITLFHRTYICVTVPLSVWLFLGLCNLFCLYVFLLQCVSSFVMCIPPPAGMFLCQCHYSCTYATPSMYMSTFLCVFSDSINNTNIRIISCQFKNVNRVVFMVSKNGINIFNL